MTKIYKFFIRLCKLYYQSVQSRVYGRLFFPVALIKCNLFTVFVNTQHSKILQYTQTITNSNSRHTCISLTEQKHSVDCTEWSLESSLQSETTLCLKEVPTFKLSVILFSKFLHCWKAYENCYKHVWHYPPHLRHVATMPWEIINSNFLQIFSRYKRKCKQVAF